jgi:hypothetical protein
MNSSAGDCCFNALKSSIIYIFLSYRTKCLTLQVCQLVLTLRAQLRIKKCQLYKYLASSNPQSTALDSVDLFPDVVVEKMLYHLLCYFMLTWSNRLNKTEIPLLTNIRKPDENLDVRFEQIGVVCSLPVVILFLFVRVKK